MFVQGYKPDTWTLLRVNDTTHKLLAGWNINRWRTCSSINRIDDLGHSWLIYGSNSTYYTCKKDACLLSQSILHLYEELILKKEKVEIVSVESLKETL